MGGCASHLYAAGPCYRGARSSPRLRGAGASQAALLVDGAALRREPRAVRPIRRGRRERKRARVCRIRRSDTGRWLRNANLACPRQGPRHIFDGIAERGVFTIRLGERDRGIPFWDEAARGLTTSGVTIYWHECSFARGRAIRKIETPTFQGIWFTRNAEEPLVAAIRTLAGLCMEMRKGGREFEERLRGFPEERMDAFPAAGFPSGLEAGRFLLRKLAGSARSRWAARGRLRLRPWNAPR